MQYIVETKSVSKIYQMGDLTIRAVDRADIQIKAGESVALVGPSGSPMRVFIAVGNPPPFITSAERSAALRAVGIDEVVLHAEAAGWAESSRMASGCLALTAVS